MLDLSYLWKSIDYWNRSERVDASSFSSTKASKTETNAVWKRIFFAKTKWYQKNSMHAADKHQPVTNLAEDVSRDMPTTVRSLAQSTVKTVASVRGHHGLIALQRPGLSDDTVIGFLGDKISGIPKHRQETG